MENKTKLMSKQAKQTLQEVIARHRARCPSDRGPITTDRQFMTSDDLRILLDAAEAGEALAVALESITSEQPRAIRHYSKGLVWSKHDKQWQACLLCNSIANWRALSVTSAAAESAQEAQEAQALETE